MIRLLNKAVEELIDKIKDKFGDDKKPDDKPVNTCPTPEKPTTPTVPDKPTQPEAPTTPPVCFDFADEIQYVEEDIPSL